MVGFTLTECTANYNCYTTKNRQIHMFLYFPPQTLSKFLLKSHKRDVLQPAERIQERSPMSRLKAKTKQKTKKVRTRCALVYAEMVGPTTGVGLLSRIASIFCIISGVNFGITSIALRLSMTCSGFDAPRMTVDVFGFTASHARAR